MAEKLDIEVALKNREFEISLFWQRSNYFLVLNTALGVAAFSARTAMLGMLIALFGMLVCYLWYQTNLGSRFWQIFWEGEVERLAPNYRLESFQLDMSEIKRRVRENVQPEKSPWWRGFIDKGVVAKPSVTITMILLSLGALIFWLLILVYQAFNLTPQRNMQAPSALSASSNTARQNATPSAGAAHRVDRANTGTTTQVGTASHGNSTENPAPNPLPAPRSN